jgi:hypothetical protein
MLEVFKEAPIQQKIYCMMIQNLFQHGAMICCFTRLLLKVGKDFHERAIKFWKNCQFNIERVKFDELI